eukprot:gene30403-36733_t
MDNTKNYRLGRRLARVCDAFEGSDLKTGEKVVLKLEHCNCRHPSLPDEHSIYQELDGTSEPKWYGTHGENNTLVLEQLGPSLQDLFDYCGKPFILKTVLMLAVQILDRLEFVHSKHYIHRGVKPDFGLSKKYWSSQSGHIPNFEGKQNREGNLIYQSIHTHLGIEQSRRDDLENLGYTLVYLLTGSLPWEKHTDFNFIPAEFKAFFVYKDKLDFEDTPYYGYQRSMFMDLFDTMGYTDDRIFDWDIVKKSLKLPPQIYASRPCLRVNNVKPEPQAVSLVGHEQTKTADLPSAPQDRQMLGENGPGNDDKITSAALVSTK